MFIFPLFGKLLDVLGSTARGAVGRGMPGGQPVPVPVKVKSRRRR